MSTTMAIVNQQILLSDVKVITLEKNRMTTGRRISPIQQLRCIGGCNEFTPDAVQCHNMGSDGNDVQWKCESEMPTNIRFGKLQVICEGYTYPDDPYILQGSCGLEYELIINNVKRDNTIYTTKNDNSIVLSFMFDLLVCIFIFFTLFHIIRWCYYSVYDIDQSHRPPPYNRDYYQHNPPNPTTYMSQSNSGWFNGAILGYLFGSSSRNNTPTNTHISRDYEPDRNNSTIRITTGFANTSRR